MRLSIFSYGSPRFSYGGQSVHFSGKNPAGKIWFEQVKDEFETLSGTVIENFNGWRVHATIRLYNFYPGDHEDHLQLVQIINNAKSDNMPFVLEPRFSNGRSFSFDALVDGNFGYEELTDLDAGQEIEIQFKSKRLLSEIPAFVKVPGYLKINTTNYLLLSTGGGKLIIA